MLELGEFFPPEELTPAAVALAIARVRSLELAPATKRYLLGEWARQMGVKLEAAKFDELRGGPEIR
jgi:hypothetical protein